MGRFTKACDREEVVELVDALQREDDTTADPDRRRRRTGADPLDRRVRKAPRPTAGRQVDRHRDAVANRVRWPAMTVAMAIVAAVAASGCGSGGPSTEASATSAPGTTATSVATTTSAPTSTVVILPSVPSPPAPTEPPEPAPLPEPEPTAPAEPSVPCTVEAVRAGPSDGSIDLSHVRAVHCNGQWALVELVNPSSEIRCTDGDFIFEYTGGRWVKRAATTNSPAGIAEQAGAPVDVVVDLLATSTPCPI